MACPPFGPRSRLQPLPSQMGGLLGAVSMSPNSGNPEGQHRHQSPAVRQVWGSCQGRLEPTGSA